MDLLLKFKSTDLASVWFSFSVTLSICFFLMQSGYKGKTGGKCSALVICFSDSKVDKNRIKH